MTQLACAFTGHRPKSFPWRYDEQDPRCAALKQTLAEQIERLADAGVTQYLSGMALGVDVWAAQAVLALREKRPELKLHCILPCIGQEKLWSEPSKALYYSMIRQADSRVYTSRAYYKDCMLDRNRFMVDHSGLLLAVYGGDPKSGTAATVNYARKLGREIWIIDPDTLLITRENTDEY